MRPNPQYLPLRGKIADVISCRKMGQLRMRDHYFPSDSARLQLAGGDEGMDRALGNAELVRGTLAVVQQSGFGFTNRCTHGSYDSCEISGVNAV